MTTTLDPTIDLRNPSSLNMGRNRLINGDMRIDQSNGGGLLTTTNNQVLGYSVDEFWQVTESSASAGTFTTQRTTTSPPGNFTHYYHMACTVANTSTLRSYMNQVVEGTLIRDLGLGGSTPSSLTLSFWTRSNLTGTFGGVITSGDGSRFYIFSYTIINANTWEYKTITFTGDPGGGTSHYPTGAVSGLVVRWAIALTQTSTPNVWVGSNVGYGPNGMNNLLSSTSNYWDITGAQLEPGTNATPFEYRPFPIEYMLCQRYYEKSYDPDVVPATSTNTGLIRLAGGQISAGTVDYNDAWFFVPKRAAPTITFWTNTGTAGQLTTVSQSGGQSGRTPTPNGNNLKGWNVICTTTDAFLFGHYTADSRL
jgi:hypothetical protein